VATIVGCSGNNGGTGPGNNGGAQVATMVGCSGNGTDNNGEVATIVGCSGNGTDNNGEVATIVGYKAIEGTTMVAQLPTIRVHRRQWLGVAVMVGTTMVGCIGNNTFAQFPQTMPVQYEDVREV